VAVHRHIHDTAGVGVTLDGLARLAGYSKFHLVRQYRRQTGLSLGAWIDRCRLERLHRLRREGRGFADIAAQLGFSGSSALSRWCRRQGLRWRDQDRDDAE
jgi:AraC-like DNA-binding protein